MDEKDLIIALDKINGREYKEYNNILGTYNFTNYSVVLDRIQWDPWAPPSQLIIRAPLSKLGFPPFLINTPSREIPFRDFIGRRFREAAGKFSKGMRGPGRGGNIEIDAGSQSILNRSSVVIKDDILEIRFKMGLPANGKQIDARGAKEMLCTDLKAIVQASILSDSIDKIKLKNHITAYEDAEAIRESLYKLNLIGFIANGSVLPRCAGDSDLPLQNAVPFKSPQELEVTITTPNSGEVTGMGIKHGVTLIVGGGFHGKSTLLNALTSGVYNHIPGDGREKVVVIEETVKIKSEDGRRVEKVNISPFIKNLPFGKDTNSFSTENASGSTSQAANIIEALELGARVLLIDEDTSATNFMIRDERMQELVAKENEPITPFVDRVRQLYTEHNVSTILVMGGSGDYFDSADQVIMMQNYSAIDKNKEAQEIIKKHHTRRKSESDGNFGAISRRCPLKNSLIPKKDKGKQQWPPSGGKTDFFGEIIIDMSYLEQIADPAQERAIKAILKYLSHDTIDKMPEKSLKEEITQILDKIKSQGIDSIAQGKAYDLALPRIFELGAVINRREGLKIKE